MREVLQSQFGSSLEAHTFFAIVRDPVERFLSGFVDKCVRRCNFRSLLTNYTLLRVPDPQQKTPSTPFPDRLMAFLVRHGISERTARFLREQLDPRGAGQGMTLHSTKGTPVHEFFERRLRGSPFLMEFVVRMFWHDFRIFDFPLPKLKFE